MYFPNAFTPNNDGRNEIFKILHPQNLSAYRLQVYNRYGQKVFETKDYSNGWNGIFKGQPATPGAYIWYCEFKQSGVLNKMKGTVLLVR
jgi:gliding motility-associated-like protein